MSECFCDYELPSMYVKTMRKARVNHRCEECGRAISAGEDYERVAAIWEGDLKVIKTCSRCVALRDHIRAHVPCFCWMHGSLLDDCKSEYENLPDEADGSGLRFELGRLAVAIKRAPSYERAVR